MNGKQGNELRKTLLTAVLFVGVWLLLAFVLYAAFGWNILLPVFLR